MSRPAKRLAKPHVVFKLEPFHQLTMTTEHYHARLTRADGAYFVKVVTFRGGKNRGRVVDQEDKWSIDEIRLAFNIAGKVPQKYQPAKFTRIIDELTFLCKDKEENDHLVRFNLDADIKDRVEKFLLHNGE